MNDEALYNLVRKYFRYRKDGVFVRLRKTANVTAIGDVVQGTLHHSGYKIIKFFDKIYVYHRLIFLWHHGFLPPILDHKDRNKLNNRIGNLRPATNSQNACNSVSANANGVKGLCFCPRRKHFYGMIQVNGKRVKFGFSKNKEQVIEKISNRRKEMHREFARD